MIRDSMDPGAANVFIAVTPGNGVSFQYRSSDGNSCGNTTTSGNAPYWVKLVMSSGTNFTGYCSPNGTNWTLVGSTSLLTNIATAYVGLAVCSHNASDLCTAKFDNVSAPGWPPTPLAAAAFAVCANQVNLTWNALANATSYNVKRSTTSGGPYTTIATGVTATNYTDLGVSVSAGCYYVISAMVGGSQTANGPEAALTFLQLPELANSIIGTPGSWNNDGNTITNVFDDNLATFFDAPNANGDWVGLDFGAGVSNFITQINYCPRAGFESRMVGGTFEGANQTSFGDAVALYTVTAQPATGVFTSACIANTSAFRFVLYLSPTNGFGNVSELQFFGYSGSVSSVSVPLPSVPTGLVAAAASGSQINLIWNAVTNAASYNVQRSLTNGGPYTVIASSVTATNYNDTGLAGGTLYYYVVNALNSGGASTNSAQAGAATLSPTLGSLVHYYSFSETGGVTVADSVGGPVWTGTLPNGGTLSGGQLALASASQQYASLPAGLVASLSNVTVTVWVNQAKAFNGSHVFDFGISSNSYMYLTPRIATSYTVRFGITTNGSGAEQQINCSSTCSTGAWYQAAVSLSGGTGILYVAGAAVGTNSGMTLNPSSLGNTVSNYLGKSQSGSVPYLNGALEDFRIYNVGLSSADIAAMVAMGPNQMLSTNSPTLGVMLTGTNLVVAWPVANPDFTVQSCTNLALGGWLNVTSAPPQIIGSNWQVALPQPTDAGPAFYRLVK